MTRHLPPRPGGQEIHVYELTQRQLKGGYEVGLWYAAGRDLPEGVEAHRVSTGLPGTGASNIVATASYARRAAREMRRQRGDIVHVHGDFPEAWYGTRVARALGVPVVMTVHAGLNVRYARITRAAIRHVAHFFALGSRVADDLRRCGVGPERTTVMSSGLDFDLLGPYLDRDIGARPRIVSVGALDSMKNHETVLAAAALVRKQHPDLEVFIVGEGRERAHLERLISARDNVHLTGQLTRPEVYELVASASVFTLASRRLAGKAEGVPTALLEAMALARPCVVSSACTPDAIAARDSGAYATADPQSPESFARAILQLLDDRATAAAMGERAAKAVAALGWDDIVARVEAVYETLFAASDGRR